MNSISEVKKILELLSKEKVNYVIIRNYGFLFDQIPGKDVDVVISKKDCSKVEKILLSENYKKQKICPFSHHMGFYKFILEEDKLVKFHFHIDGISGRHVIYLKAEDLFKTKKFVKNVPVISTENTILSLAIHSKLGINSRKNCASIVNKILDKDFDKKYVKDKLTDLIGKKLTQTFLTLLYSRKFNELDLLKKEVKKKLILKNLKKVSKIRLGCVLWKIKELFKGAPVIAFIGMDGAGKTTLTNNLKKIFDKNQIKTELIYTGRGKNNLLPIQKVGKPYKKIEKKVKIPKFAIKILYVLFSPVFFFDLLLRFVFVIYPAKLRNKIVLTDRYSSDMLLMKHVPKVLKNIYYSLLPKPTILFYIYNDIKILNKRKPDHPFEDLKRQEKLFEQINKKLNPIKIKNEDLKKSKDFILNEIFNKVNL